MFMFLNNMFRFLSGRGEWFNEEETNFTELTGTQQTVFLRAIVYDSHWNRNEIRACKRYGVIIDDEKQLRRDRISTSLWMHGD